MAMKTKSNNNPSKLQSEAVLEFNKIYGKRLDTMEMLYLNHGGEQFEGKIIQDFISDQIQKAYSKGREEIEPFKTFLLNEGYSEEAISLIGYEDLSIQSKEK
jgi:hypothetical protein